MSSYLFYLVFTRQIIFQQPFPIYIKDISYATTFQPKFTSYWDNVANENT